MILQQVNVSTSQQPFLKSLFVQRWEITFAEYFSSLQTFSFAWFQAIHSMTKLNRYYKNISDDIMEAFYGEGNFLQVRPFN